MNSQTSHPLKSILLLPFLLLFRARSSSGLTTDGLILISFKLSVTTDPFGALQTWNYQDQSPCSWNGVTCGAPAAGAADLRVTGLVLPNCGLSGTIPAILGTIQFLQVLNLSGNSINGSIPLSLFGAGQLQILDLSDNLISGDVPELVGNLRSLRILNLSDNSLAGSVPRNLTALRNLREVYLGNNYFSGAIPAGFDSVRVLDLSSNLIGGSLPPDFGGRSVSYLNVSFNRISGEIPPGFAAGIPVNATVDLSFNNLTGRIPDSDLLMNQSGNAFSGNPDLCGRPLRTPCRVPAAVGTPPQDSSESPPAIAAIPTTIESNPAPAGKQKPKLSTGSIAGIVIGDGVGILILAAIFVYIYRLKRKRKKPPPATSPAPTIGRTIKRQSESPKEYQFDWAASESSSEEYNWLRTWTCLKKPRHAASGEENEEDDETTSSESVDSDGETKKLRGQQKNGSLVTLHGEIELELETLLKASAYILGASGSSIMYKAVLHDGAVLAVRRIGENGVERFRDFENQVRVIAKLVHPNLVRILGFYWGTDEKLIIYDFVPNGSLATVRHRRPGSSLSSHLPFEIRLKIAKGVARGLSYIHEKKHVHGNLKPSNVLLGHDMEPKIGDFGLERLVGADHSSKTVIGSARNFGSKRSNTSAETVHDFINGPNPSPSPSSIGLSPYNAPESLRSLKPSPKWDVFSYGVVLLELLTGKIVSSEEMGHGLPVGASPCTEEEKGKVLRMADGAIRAEIEGREEALLGLLKLGFGCVSAVPQKRPSMKEVLHALERYSSSLGSSTSYC
ncbi:probable LRR receptor-like serine/threonine-protein kinase At4g37250 [Andrographis paniculata]|uniref:probable LRR receptor-like serine/threonine-protein kinase At4g37250 n=1 Tax=Andrographis paniculata TaxID=175694 RepID=UPI0021E86D64|nr:probable LRR receptor-like serine/threonine-protein kinase At4g37250 [Andrographis paniculata]